MRRQYYKINERPATGHAASEVIPSMPVNIWWQGQVQRALTELLLQSFALSAPLWREKLFRKTTVKIDGNTGHWDQLFQTADICSQKNQLAIPLTPRVKRRAGVIFPGTNSSGEGERVVICRERTEKTVALFIHLHAQNRRRSWVEFDLSCTELKEKTRLVLYKQPPLSIYLRLFLCRSNSCPPASLSLCLSECAGTNELCE